MTNREAHEEAAGMSLSELFFISNGIDPDAEYEPNQNSGLKMKRQGKSETCKKCGVEVYVGSGLKNPRCPKCKTPFKDHWQRTQMAMREASKRHSGTGEK